MKISFHSEFIEVIADFSLDYLYFIEEIKYSCVHKLIEFVNGSLGSRGMIDCNYDN